MTSYTLQVQPRRQYNIQYANERGPQGPAGPATTDASLLVSGTLADARLSSNVALENAANVFTAKQSFSGTDHVGLCLQSLTTAQYNALTATNGDLFRDSTTDRIDARLARGTVELVDTAGGQTINGALTVGGQVVFIAGSKSNPSLRLGYSASNTGLYGSAAGTNPGLGLTIGGTSYLVTHDSTTGFCIHPAWGFCWGDSQADSTVDAALRRSGVGQIDSRANNGFRSRNLANNTDAPITCSNLTASGTVSTNTIATASGSTFTINNDGNSRWVFNAGELNIAGQIVPNTNNSRQLGSSSNRWSTVFGVAGDFSGNLTASGTVRLGTFTVGTLPSAAANTRALAFVTDSNLAFNSTNLGLTVTAGGSTLVPVFSNGTNWVIG